MGTTHLVIPKCNCSYWKFPGKCGYRTVIEQRTSSLTQIGLSIATPISSQQPFVGWCILMLVSRDHLFQSSLLLWCKGAAWEDPWLRTHFCPLQLTHVTFCESLLLCQSPSTAASLSPNGFDKPSLGPSTLLLFPHWDHVYFVRLVWVWIKQKSCLRLKRLTKTLFICSKHWRWY